MPRLLPCDILARWMAPLSLICLLACSGSASVNAPATTPEAPGNTVQIGGALDAPPGATNPGSFPGPMAASNVAAAQPLSGGFPAPAIDPNSKFFQLHLFEEKPICQYLDQNSAQFSFKGFVFYTDPENLNIPEDLVVFLAQGSLRVVDLIAGKYTEVPFSYKQSFDQYGVQYNKVGYTEFSVMGPFKYHLKFFVVPPSGTTPLSTPWTACPDAACEPPPIENIVPRVVVPTPSGELEQSYPAETILVCKAGGRSHDWPNWFGD